MGAVTGDAAVDPLQQFRSWSSVLFALLGAVTLIAAAVVLPSTYAPQTYVVLAATAIGAGIYLVTSLAIGRGDAWAIHAIVPICVLLIFAGLIRTAAAFTRGEISVPLEVLGAIAVLTRPHLPDVLPALSARGRRSVWIAVGGLVVSQLLPYAASPLWTTTVFGAKEDDLALSVTIDCPAPGDTAGLITARAAWSWARSVPFAPPDDAVVIDWLATTDVDAGPGTAALATRVSDHATMTPGSGSGATDTVLEPYRNAAAQSVGVGIRRAGSDLQDGWAEVDIEPNDTPPETLEFRATYAHGDRWVRRSEPAFCS
jgi:hypothetical protein